MSLEQQYSELKEKTNKAIKTEAVVRERKNAAEKDLKTLLGKIKDAGYDHKELKSIKLKKETELKNVLETAEKEIDLTLEKLEAIESATR